MKHARVLPALVAALLGAAGCDGMTGGDTVAAREWGPHDGHDLAATDLDRLQVGDPAPDFTLPAFEGDPVTLSDYRGEKTVLLVFYRGHW